MTELEAELLQEVLLSQYQEILQKLNDISAIIAVFFGFFIGHLVIEFVRIFLSKGKDDE